MKNRQCVKRCGGGLGILAALLILALAAGVIFGKRQTQETVFTEETLRTMTYNIYVGNQTDERRAEVLQVILDYLPDTLGVQEADAKWMRYLRKHLGDIYGFAGDGRLGGNRGEHCAILYRKDRFELLETDTKWLSDYPAVVSKFKESNYYRIMTYAILRDKATDITFAAVNTHLDNGDYRVRQRQWEVLKEQLEKLKDYPIVLTGDFNTIRGGPLYKEIGVYLTDSSKIAVQKTDGATLFHSDGRIIDFIFVSDRIEEVLEYRVIVKEGADEQPSDHAPVLIVYKIETSE